MWQDIMAMRQDADRNESMPFKKGLNTKRTQIQIWLADGFFHVNNHCTYYFAPYIFQHMQIQNLITNICKLNTYI